MPITRADISRAKQAFDAGDYLLAAERFRLLLQVQPNNTSWLYMLACAHGELGRLAETGRVIALGLKIDPSHRGLLTRLARLHLGREDLPAAHEAIDRAIATSPNEPRPISVKGELLVYEGKSEDAIALLEEAMSCCEPVYPLAIVYAQACRGLSRNDDALAVLEPLRGEASLPPMVRRSLFFQLGEVLDKLARYDEAFAAYADGNALRTASFDPAAFERSIDLLIERWRPGSFDLSSESSDRPVFIVGLPRTGTSLLEQILSRSDDIYAAGELPHIRLIAHALRASEVPGLDHVHRVDNLHEALLKKHARDYLKECAPKAITAPRVIDKDPMNIEHLGLIRAMLPNARIIHCTREPLDAGLSIFFQDFHSQLSWASDLASIGVYARSIARLMSHWRSVLGIEILEVPYERVASQTEATVREVYEFLEIEFDSRSLSPHESDRVVFTASNQQVREPIHTRSVARWKNYEAQLEPLRKALTG